MPDFTQKILNNNGVIPEAEKAKPHTIKISENFPKFESKNCTFEKLPKPDEIRPSFLPPLPDKSLIEHAEKMIDLETDQVIELDAEKSAENEPKNCL